jgi:hypothetical protein
MTSYQSLQRKTPRTPSVILQLVSSLTDAADFFGDDDAAAAEGNNDNGDVPPDETVTFCPDDDGVPTSDLITSYPGDGIVVIVSLGKTTGTVVADGTNMYVEDEITVVHPVRSGN